MPIDRAVFQREMSMIAERFNRTVSQPVRDRYAEYLNARLSTEEFVRGAREIFANDKYWPPPVRFVEAALGDATELAEAAYRNLLEAATNGVAPALTPAERRAIKAIGGFRELMYAEGEVKQAQIRREFLREYAAAVMDLRDELPALPAERLS